MQVTLTEKEQKIFDIAYESGYVEGHKDGEIGRMKLSAKFKQEDGARIANICCTYFNLEWNMMLKKTRKRFIVYPRQMTITMVAKFTRFTLKDIGYMFQGKDHTTVIHARNKINDLCDIDEEVKKDFNYLSEVIRRAVINNEEPVIEVKPVSIAIRKLWTEQYRDYKKQKESAMRNALREEAKIETSVVLFQRPAAEYSNTGHLDLLNRYSEVS